MERRSVFKILGAGLGAAAAGSAAEYTPRALTAAEYATVDALAEVILPADATSPGAHDAGVARYIDIVLLYGDKPTLASWQNGLKSLDETSQSAHGRHFKELPVEQKTGIVRTMAANEANAVSPLDTLFVAVKRLAIEAFYLSPAGKQSLEYKGDTAIAQFPGCTEPEHKGSGSVR